MTRTKTDFQEQWLTLSKAVGSLNKMRIEKHLLDLVIFARPVSKRQYAHYKLK